MIEIPISGGAQNAHQSLSVQLGDNLVDLEINYLTRFGQWSMNARVGEELKIAGAMLLPSADLSEAHRAGLGRFVFIGDEPTLDNLGKNNRLVWIDG